MPFALRTRTPLLPAALAFVSFGFVLVRVRVRVRVHARALVFGERRRLLSPVSTAIGRVLVRVRARIPISKLGVSGLMIKPRAARAED